jgi:hypothetical protein
MYVEPEAAITVFELLMMVGAMTTAGNHKGM